MFTLVEMAVLAAGILIIGLCVAIPAAILYYLMKLIDRRFHSDKEEKPDQETFKKRTLTKEEKVILKDDIPFSTPMKVETSFDDRRIGKQN